MLGVAALSACSCAYAWRAASLSLRRDGDGAFISIVLLGVVVGVFLQGFVQWTILDPWHTPTALWFLAMLVAERSRQRAEAGQMAVGMGNQVMASEPVAHG